MAVEIKNTSNRALTFELPVRCAHEECRPTDITQYQPRTNKRGEAYYKPRKVRMPPSITLRAGESREFPDSVLAASMVKKALAKRKLKLMSRTRGQPRPARPREMPAALLAPEELPKPKMPRKAKAYVKAEE